MSLLFVLRFINFWNFLSSATAQKLLIVYSRRNRVGSKNRHGLTVKDFWTNALDTNIAIALLNGDESVIRLLNQTETIYLPVIVVGELLSWISTN